MESWAFTLQSPLGRAEVAASSAVGDVGLDGAFASQATAPITATTKAAQRSVEMEMRMGLS